MTIDHPVQATAADLLRSARELAWSDDESAAPEAYDCAIKAIECAFVPVMAADDLHYNVADLVMTFRSRREPWDTPIPSRFGARIDDSTCWTPYGALVRTRTTSSQSRLTTRRWRSPSQRRSSAWSNRVSSSTGAKLTPEEEAEDLRIAEESLAWYDEHGDDDVISFEDYLKERAEQDADG